MLILNEKKTSKKEASEWQPSSKDALRSALRRFSSRKFDIFLVGPDRYWIEDGKLTGVSQGVHYFIDKNGFICGFDVRTISDRVEQQNDVLWSFSIGRQEIQLVIS